MAVYLSEQKMLFIHIPKTGGTSVRDWLESNVMYAKRAKPKHAKPEIFSQLEYDQYFTVVRNPYARLLSWYTYHFTYNISKENFNDWLLNIDKTPSLKDAIWWTQKSYVALGNPIILKTENLNEDFKQIQNIVGIHKELPYNNTSSKVNYKEFYNNTSKKFVEDFYAEDLEYFDYTFEG